MHLCQPTMGRCVCVNTRACPIAAPTRTHPGGSTQQWGGRMQEGMHSCVPCSATPDTKHQQALVCTHSVICVQQPVLGVLVCKRLRQLCAAQVSQTTDACIFAQCWTSVCKPKMGYIMQANADSRLSVWRMGARPATPITSFYQCRSRRSRQPQVGANATARQQGQPCWWPSAAGACV